MERKNEIKNVDEKEKDDEKIQEVQREIKALEEN